jgi:hypothetical protein
VRKDLNLRTNGRVLQQMRQLHDFAEYDTKVGSRDTSLLRSIYKQRHTKNTTTEYAKVGRLVFKELEQLGKVITEAPDDDTKL